MDARGAASQTAIPESLVPPSGSKKNSCFFRAGAHGKREAQPATPQNQRTLGGTGAHAHLTTAKKMPRLVSSPFPTDKDTVTRAQKLVGQAETLLSP